MAGDVVPAGGAVELIVEIKGASGQRLEVIRRGQIDADLSRQVTSGDYRDAFTIRPAHGDWVAPQPAR